MLVCRALKISDRYSPILGKGPAIDGEVGDLDKEKAKHHVAGDYVIVYS